MNWKRFHDPHVTHLALRTFSKYYGCHPTHFPQEYLSRWDDKDWIQRSLGVYKKTRVPCSCYMCMNERHNKCFKEKDRIPFKELKQRQAMKEDLEEIIT